MGKFLRNQTSSSFSLRTNLIYPPPNHSFLHFGGEKAHHLVLLLFSSNNPIGFRRRNRHGWYHGETLQKRALLFFFSMSSARPSVAEIPHPRPPTRSTTQGNGSWRSAPSSCLAPLRHDLRAMASPHTATKPFLGFDIDSTNPSPALLQRFGLVTIHCPLG